MSDPMEKVWGRRALLTRRQRLWLQLRHGRLGRNLLVGAVTLSMLFAGGVLVWAGLLPHETSAPLPTDQAATASQKPLGPDGNSTVDVSNADDGSGPDGSSDGSDITGDATNSGTMLVSMSVATMQLNSVFVPAVGVYASIRDSSTFTTSRYQGFDTLQLPGNPRRVSRYSAGAPLVGSSQGSTLLAGHIAYGGITGAFHDLYLAKPGQTIWTKAADGTTQRWQVSRIYSQPQNQFPQGYWSATGVRQLVLVTCGGAVVSHHYVRNVFVVATPVS